MINVNNRTNYIWQTDAWPNFSVDERAISEPLGAAIFAIGRIQGLNSGFSHKDQIESLASEIALEAAASYAIESEKLDVESVTQSVMASLSVTHQKHLNNQHENVAALMLDARDRSCPVDEARLFGWHRLMFPIRSLGVKEIGGWRQSEMEVVSGRIGHFKTEFEAPKPEAVPDLMTEFLKALSQRPARHILIEAAVMHIWFESIHPFEDGNGRIGRMLIEHQLAGLSEQPLPISPSQAILARRKEYYDQLKAVQSAHQAENGSIDATDFVSWMLSVFKEAADTAYDQLMFLTRRNQFFERWSGSISSRQELVLRRIFQEGPERVALGLSRKPYMKIADVSDQTAVRDIADLVGKGVLGPAEGKGRATRYGILLPE